MFHVTLLQRWTWFGTYLVAALVIALILAVFATPMAFADPPSVGQLADFYYAPDYTTQVVSANGEPDDAALFRFAETRRDGVEWQLMTQHLTPGTRYDVWITDATNFSWQVGSGKATVQGELNQFGFVHVGDEPPGAGIGAFTDPMATLYLVIVDHASGNAVQAAFFPAP